jgi:nicotinamide mononucleotide transporter
MISDWIADNFIEIFGAVTGILYVFLEIRQTIWLWPVGIITSAVYIWVFFTGKLYADMSLQGYYLVISIIGWYWWAQGGGFAGRSLGEGRAQGTERRAQGSGELETEEENWRRGGPPSPELRRTKEGENGGEKKNEELQVTRIKLRTGIILAVVFVLLYWVMWFILTRMTDSPVPGRDSFITSLSIIATWMLARKIYEHWYLWIVVNTAACFFFFYRVLFGTVIVSILSIV